MNKLITLLTAALILTSISGCIKDNFDAPPVGGKDLGVGINFTIDSLKARYNGQPYAITEELIISGIVTADDKSGNFYKQIIIQDNTAGICVLLDGNGIYNDYPIGRRIYIKLKGLYVVSYKNLIQICAAVLPDGSFAGIPTSLYDRFILKGSYFHYVKPKQVTLSQLNNSYQNMLIELNGVEYQSADAGETYADVYTKSSLTRVIKDCNGGVMDTYNSGFSNFANELTPTGKGTMVAIYSVYNTDGQLLLRDPSDLKMDSTRCGGIITSSGGLLGIRALGAGTVLPSNTIARGIVISDRTNANCDPKNLIIQDSTGGMAIRFASAHSFNLGDDVSINVGGLNLVTFNGLMQIDKSTTPYGVPLSNASVLGSGTITPRIATTVEVQANGNLWESTLVTIQNAVIGGSGTTYGSTQTITDVNGSVNHFTRSAATFFGTTLPSGNKSFTGVIGNFNGYQLQIRNLSDVQ